LNFINDGGDDSDVLDGPMLHVQLPLVVVVHIQPEQVDNTPQVQVVLLQAVHKPLVEVVHIQLVLEDLQFDQ
jgi:hypothetical protein